ncbi:MAG: hypothetical protein IPN96_20990 [Anaerolineales bacterium]|nr:hypothetical protein [Anaerolineales bacterium]
MIDILKSQMDHDEDELILIQDDGLVQAGKKMNDAIHFAKNSLLVIADANIVPCENWLKLMTDVMRKPECGLCIG